MVMDDGSAQRRGRVFRESETDIFDSFVTTGSGWRRTGGHVRSFSRRFAHGDGRGDALCRADHSGATITAARAASKVVDVGGAGTKDLQQVNLTLRVLCRPDVSKLPKIHQELGQDYDDRVLPSIGNLKC